MADRETCQLGRRNIIKGIAATVTTLGGSKYAHLPGTVKAHTGDLLILGNFESSLDNWLTSGLNSLQTVHKPLMATRGEYMLKVNVDSTPISNIYNIDDVEGVDFSNPPTGGADIQNHPYLLADVRPSLVYQGSEIIESELEFKFRLHYSEIDQPDLVSIVESDGIQVPPLKATSIGWNLESIFSDLANPIANNPSNILVDRLELVWYPSTVTNPELSTFVYQGEVLIDNIRASSRIDDLSTARRHLQMFRLRDAHNGISRYRPSSVSNNKEEGEILFEDGAEVPYSFKIVDSQKIVQTINDESYQFGGGW